MLDKKTLEQILDNIEDRSVRSYFYRYQQWLLNYRQQILHNYELNRFKIIDNDNLQKLHFYHLMNFSWEVNNYYHQMIVYNNSFASSDAQVNEESNDNQEIKESLHKDFNEQPINKSILSMEDKIKSFLKDD